MKPTNLFVDVTVTSIDNETYIPDRCLPLTEGMTHLVDIIEVSRNNSNVAGHIYLEGRFNDVMRIFHFSDNVKYELLPVFQKAFGACAEQMIGIVEETVNYNIIAEIALSLPTR